MKILLVDDDTSVIQAVLAILKTLPGHDVRVATSGGKAIENAGVLGGVDLLITDVVMEPMDGFTLRDQLKALYPNLRTILMSGYDLSDYADQTKGHQFLQKPLDPAAVKTAVEGELHPRVPPPPVAVAPRPVAVPVTQPRVAAVPQPAAVVAAQPVAVPRPAAVAQPTAVPKAVPVARPAAPVAKPVVVPKAAAVPQPPSVAQPTPVAKSTAPPVLGPQPTAAPRPAPVAQPAAIPKPAAPRPVAAPPAAARPVPVPVVGPRAAAGTVAMSIPGLDTKPGEFTGQTIGSYEVGNQIGADEWGAIYAATQTGINRAVSLHVLSVERALDEASRLRFVADARAKANVQHPSILAVYEAGDTEGRFFYAHEYVDGLNLVQLASRGQKVIERTALNILRTVADGVAYLDAHGIPRLPADGTSAQLGTDGQARLSNLAVQAAAEPTSPPDEIVAVGRAMFAIVHTGPGFSAEVRGLLGRMVQAPASGLTNWADVLEGVKSAEPKNIPTHVAEIGAQERAAAAALEAARVQKQKELRRNIISMVSCVVLAALIVAWVMRNRQRVVNKMVHIPAGTYTVGQKKVTLPEFWIDKYEVTIGQYAKFIDYLDEHPGNSRDFDHDRQPKQLDHKPKYWAIYYGQAANGGAVHSAPYTLDSPMVEVTFWDAYAYAKWLGRELPTEEQWEAAARGPEGFVYPWGNDPDEKKVNSGADFVKNDPAAKGKIDGWNFWNRVDKVSGDKSAFGVYGMAGNVSEWTGTWTPDNRYPIVKGGNYMSADVRLDKRVEDQDGSKGAEHIGFRTVTTNKPSNAE